MAQLDAKVMVDKDWLENDELLFYVGTENTANLAASTPAGGSEVLNQQVWANGASRGGFGAGGYGSAPFGESEIGYGFGEGDFGFEAFGLNDIPRAVLSYRYMPTDKCAALPVGVKIKDRAGNESVVLELLAQLADLPVGARSLAVAATANPGEVNVTWTTSTDV